MTDSLLRRAQHALAPLQRREVEAALRMCAADPVASVLPAMHLEVARDSGVIPRGMWSVRRRSGLQRDLAGIVWNGANLSAVLPTTPDDPSGDDLRADVASGMVARLSRPAALVGSADLILDLWGRVEPWWGPARELRPRQLSMALSTDPRQPAPIRGDGELDLEPLRQATMDDYDILLPACVHMFIGEVGYDPMRHGRAAYEERLRYLVREGRSYVQLGSIRGRRPEVVFKAEVGVLGGGVAQVQGVWTHPDLRGRGIAENGMAALVRQIHADVAPTASLYVNDFNSAALAVYRRVGFREVGSFATVMF
ncbi:GNAT family N-acetyltransferase [Demequina zhanjiangensis]|uniref:GNAT family N-acetyltransferase n=1 Tax=Demequina zhanjiangensis TaxID=3051659 RepID=A0ABT8G375_9MICO|nr:GNAT family N-acetyltransferase [Demequina sp. SYSU T00b26]MDN4473596.1 GNAT family N-acetyltransferase [Demequina sp. SYSU T00b26]